MELYKEIIPLFNKLGNNHFLRLVISDNITDRQ